MAELIDKGALSKEIESLTVHITGLRSGKGVISNYMDEYRKSVLRIIDEQPTTTEAEIRAKAISDVFEFLKNKRDKKTMRVDFDDLEIREYKEQLAEQLKGE